RPRPPPEHRSPPTAHSCYSSCFPRDLRDFQLLLDETLGGSRLPLARPLWAAPILRSSPKWPEIYTNVGRTVNQKLYHILCSFGGPAPRFCVNCFTRPRAHAALGSGGTSVKLAES